MADRIQGRLAGQVALVTGAGRGIGAAIARALLAEGATVWLTDLSEPSGPADALGATARRRAAPGSTCGRRRTGRR